MPKRTDVQKILIIGSGPIQIGQAAEFDFSGSQACQSVREEGYQVVLVNSNPATIQTDVETADAVYCEPLTADSVTQIIAKERPDGVLAGMGGQTALNLVSELAELGVLEKYGVKLDRRSPLEVLEDKLDRLSKKAKNPEPEKKNVVKIARTIRNKKTGNTFGPLPGWENNPDFEVIEWETEDGND